MIRDLIVKNRSYRRFHQEVPVARETLRELVDLARLSASAANLQPLKYILSCEPEKNALIFSCLQVGGLHQGLARARRGREAVSLYHHPRRYQHQPRFPLRPRHRRAEHHARRYREGAGGMHPGGRAEDQAAQAAQDSGALRDSARAGAGQAQGEGDAGDGGRRRRY